MTAVPRNRPQLPRRDLQTIPDRIIARPTRMTPLASCLLPSPPKTMENAANISRGIVVMVPIDPEDSPRSDWMASARGPTHVIGALRQQAAAMTATSSRTALSRLFRSTTLWCNWFGAGDDPRGRITPSYRCPLSGS